MLPLVTLIGLVTRLDGIGIYTIFAPLNTYFPDVVDGEVIIPLCCYSPALPGVGSRCYC